MEPRFDRMGIGLTDREQCESSRAPHCFRLLLFGDPDTGIVIALVFARTNRDAHAGEDGQRRANDECGLSDPVIMCAGGREILKPGVVRWLDGIVDQYGAIVLAGAWLKRGSAYSDVVVEPGFVDRERVAPGWSALPKVDPSHGRSLRCVRRLWLHAAQRPRNCALISTARRRQRCPRFPRGGRMREPGPWVRPCAASRG